MCIQRWLGLVLLLAGACASPRPPARTVAVTSFALARGDRDLSPRIFYAGRAGSAAAPWRSRPVFVGELVAENAPPAEGGRQPLVVLSHGYWGGTFSQAWLAGRLVEAGYVVAALQHPGTMTDAQTAAGRVRLWDRARDVSFLLDRLLADPTWGPRIDPQQIAVVGHSFGGWTAMALAGGVYSLHRQLAACRALTRRDLSCQGFLADEGASVSHEGDDAPSADPRIRAFVALAPGAVGGFSRPSLAAITRPLLVVAATNDDVTDDVANAELAAAAVPGARFHRVAGDHFAFVPQCNWLGKLRIGLVCKSGGAERARQHDAIAATVLPFLRGALRLAPATAEVRR